MALLFMDGFEHIDDGYDLVKYDYNQLVYSSGIGRLGDFGAYFAAVSSSYYAQKDLGANYTTLIAGIAFKNGSGGGALLRFRDAGTTQVYVNLESDGALKVYRGAVVIGSTSTGAVPFDIWQYIEAKVTFSNTVGTVEVRLNGSGTPVINISGQDTVSTGNEYANQVAFGNFASTYGYVDDFYICDTSGGVNDDFLGDCHVTTLYPTSDGTNTDFTPSTGSDHYAVVDDPQLTGTTDYNESSTVGHKDSYGMTTFSGTGTVFGVQICASVLNPDVGAMNVRTLMISGAVPAETEGSDLALSQTMQGAISIYDQEPIDAVSWTAAKINAAEFGLKIQS